MTVTGTQPDSPREWQAVFVGDSARNCVVGSTAEHFPPARLDGYRLIAANETTRVATYRLASAGTAADSAASGPAGTRTEPSCSGSGQDDSGELRPSLYWRDVEALAAQLEPKAFDPNQPALIGWRKRTQAEALAHAAKVIELGWRRVSVDDDTAGLTEDEARDVAEALHCVEADGACHWPTVAGILAAEVRRLRAAVQALRDGSNQ